MVYKEKNFLVLNNGSETIDNLYLMLREFNVKFEVKNPGQYFNPENYLGIIISGGFLPRNSYRELLSWYRNLLSSTSLPILGICLGLRILGYHYGARIRRMGEGENGVVKIFFHKDYPLAPGIKELKVYELHDYELISTGESLENYASSEKCRIQAVKHKIKPQYGVQFHPEVNSNNDGKIVIKNFIKECLKKTKEVP